ncbi:MAG: hypothetical protein HRT77_12980 [Halioglobus sp.]|nr:hypothetical protein [Halioglobus sp.]
MGGVTASALRAWLIGTLFGRGSNDGVPLNMANTAARARVRCTEAMPTPCGHRFILVVLYHGVSIFL